jgi:predicted anti-sigma-YlaC factor YlaD
MKHWTEPDFKQWLYGLKEEDSHLHECSQCRAELDRLRLTRQRVLKAPEVPQEFLAAQRRGIYNRLTHATRNFAPLRWALSVAMLLVLVAGLTLPRFRQSPVTLTTDEQLFSDLAAIEQTDEPKAIQPLHKLFEDQ